MAYPYEWPERERARRYQQRLADEQMWGRGGLEERGGGTDDEAFYARYDEPHAYARRAARLREQEGEDRSFERDARHAGRGAGRGWRRFTEGVRHAFDEDRPAGYSDDPRRGGGMFGGQDRPGSLFSHRDGLGARPIGEHSGKGPKGYVRSDARILEDVCDRLADDGRLDAGYIEVKVDSGEVTLNGEVRDRMDKRRAEDIAESVSGVKHLQNNLRVRPPEQPAQKQAEAQPQRRAVAQAEVHPAPTSAQIAGPKDGGSKTAAPKTAAPKASPSRPN